MMLLIDVYDKLKWILRTKKNYKRILHYLELSVLMIAGWLNHEPQSGRAHLKLKCLWASDEWKLTEYHHPSQVIELSVLGWGK